MTLITTALADDAVVQVSDRRLTEGTNPLEKPENKAICVSCADANFTLAFTGLARLSGEPTAEWAVNQMGAIDASALTFPEITEKFRQIATVTFGSARSGSTQPGLTFVFAGFGPPGPFAAVVSNMENGKTWFPTPRREFISGFFLRNSKRMRKLDLMFNGREDAIPDTIGNVIGCVRRHFLRRTPDERARMLVNLIRRAANHPTVGKYIGKDCTNVIVPISGDFVSHYHPVNADPIGYGPNLVTGGMLFARVSYSLPPAWTIQLGGWQQR